MGTHTMAANGKVGVDMGLINLFRQLRLFAKLSKSFPQRRKLNANDLAYLMAKSAEHKLLLAKQYEVNRNETV